MLCRVVQKYSNGVKVIYPLHHIHLRQGRMWLQTLALKKRQQKSTIDRIYVQWPKDFQ